MSRTAKAEKIAAEITNDSRWEYIVARDPAADGKFYYSVETTGVYCRPTCAARLARPENVRFHDTREDAERSGFRACKRCKPDQPSLTEQHGATIADVCRLIERSEELPTLEDLSRHARLSRFHLHRIFKSVTGVTPKQYATAHRADRLRSKLGTSATITEAIYEAGYNSNARFYETSNALLGMTASDYRAGGAGTSIRFAVGECSLGSILVAQSDRGICSILMGDDPDALTRDLQDRFPEADLIGGNTDFEQLVSQVVGLVEAPSIGLDLPLDVRGTTFQHRVW